MNGKSLLIFVAVVLTTLQSAAAADDLAGIQFSGFFSGVSAISDVEDEYIERLSDELSYDETRFGLNMRANPSERLSLQGQIFMSGTEDHYNAHMDWGFASYAANENVSVHVGKLKFPNMLFSETFSVGVIYPWARLPQEVYNLEAGGSNLFFESFNGTQVTLAHTIGDTELQLDAYRGNTDFEDGHFNDMTGYALSLSWHNTVLKAGFNRGELHVEEAHERPLIEGETRTSWSVSAQTEWNNLALWAEYGSSEFDGLGAADEAGPFDIDLSELDTDAWYVAAAYQIGKFRPVITVGRQEQDSGSGQDSISLGLNYNLGPKAVAKLEWTKIDPTERSGTSALAMAGFDEQAGLFFEGIQESDATIITLSLDMAF